MPVVKQLLKHEIILSKWQPVKHKSYRVSFFIDIY